MIKKKIKSEKTKNDFLKKYKKVKLQQKEKRSKWPEIKENI